MDTATMDPATNDAPVPEFDASDEAERIRENAAGQLSWPIGGIRPTTARFQLTGGDVEIPASDCPDKDTELKVTVTGWVKTVKDTTEKKGGDAARVAVFVVEDVVSIVEE